MLLEPKRKKFSKLHKPKVNFKQNEIREVIGSMGCYYLKAQESGKITATELESLRRVLSKRLKKKSKYKLCIFPDKSIVASPAEVRMGKGKGKVVGWVALVRKGKILVEVEGFGLNRIVAYKILREAEQRIGLKTSIGVLKF